MAKNVENLTKTTRQKQLIANLRGVKNLGMPENLYSGAGGVLTELPREILAFHRGSAFEGGVASRHHRYVLVFCLQEPRGVILDGRVFPLSPGQGMLIFPYQGHYYTSAPPEGDFSWLFVTFELANASQVGVLRNHPFEMTDEAWRGLQSLVDEVHSNRKSAARTSGLVNLKLAMLLAEFVQARHDQPAFLRDNDDDEVAGDPRDVGFMQGVCEYVYANLDADLSMETIATHMSLSASRLQAKFRETLGRPLGEFIRNVRINAACSYLHSSDMTVSEISRTVGFQSLFSFSRAFKRKMSCSPLNYRKQAQAIPGQ